MTPRPPHRRSESVPAPRVRGRCARSERTRPAVWLLGGLFAGLLLAWARPTWAAPPATGATAHAEYRELIDQAVREFRDGNWPEARVLFQAAHELEPSARTLRGIGLAEFEERSYVAAIQTLRASLDDTRKPLPPDQRVQVESVIERASRFIARYALALTPSEATLKVDGREPTVVDGTLLLDPGFHQIEVLAEGFHSDLRQLRVRADDRGTLRVALSPEPEATPVEVAKVDAADEPVSEPPEEAPYMNLQRWVGVGTGAAGVAFLSTSLALTLTARNKRDEADCRKESGGVVCPSAKAQKQREQARTLARAATATVVVGATAVAAGAVLLLWPERERPPGEGALQAALRGSRVAPTVSPGQAGLCWGGSF